MVIIISRTEAKKKPRPAGHNNIQNRGKMLNVLRLKNQLMSELKYLVFEFQALVLFSDYGVKFNYQEPEPLKSNMLLGHL